MGEGMNEIRFAERSEHYAAEITAVARQAKPIEGAEVDDGAGHVAVTGRRNRKRRPRTSHKISNRATRRTAELLDKWKNEVGRLDSRGRIGRLLEAVLPSRS